MSNKHTKKIEMKRTLNGQYRHVIIIIAKSVWNILDAVSLFFCAENTTAPKVTKIKKQKCK